MSLVLLLLLSSSSLTTSPQAQASLLSSLASSSITYNYYGPGIFGATLPNGTTFENFSNPPQLADINISFSVSQSKLNASFQYTLTNHSPIKGTLDLRVDPSTLRLTQDNMSLGYFYLWLPQRYANGSVINNFLTVVDTLNETYNLDGHVLDKQGLDYVIASSETPFVNVINVYNASTGAAVSLMIPGLFPFSVRQVESGNFTEGHKDIGHTPLGVLLDLDWTNFEPGPSGFLGSIKPCEYCFPTTVCNCPADVGQWVKQHSSGSKWWFQRTRIIPCHRGCPRDCRLRRRSWLEFVKKSQARSVEAKE